MNFRLGTRAIFSTRVLGDGKIAKTEKFFPILGYRYRHYHITGVKKNRGGAWRNK